MIPATRTGRATVRVGLGLLVALTACGGGAGLSSPGPGRAAATLDSAAITGIADILRHEDRRVYDDAAFRARVEGAVPEVRRRATLAAGRIGDTTAVPFLLERLRSDPSPAVRADAAFALGELGHAGTGVLEGLREAAPDAWIPVRDEEVAVGVEVLAALGKLGGARARRMVRDALREAHPATAPRTRRIAAEALLTVWKFDDGPGNVLAAAPYLDAPDPALRWRAVYALARGGDPTAVPRVLGLPEDAEHRVREYIARTLTAPRADSASAADSARAWLVGALDDPHPHVRVNALRSLATYGDRAPLADMARLLGDPDANVAVAAAEGLGALGPAAATALDAALDTGQGPIPVLGAVLSALARADPGRAAPRLREWAAGDARSRYFAARAAAAMPPARSLELARELARDPDTHVAVAALGAAAAIADDSAAAPDLRAGAREVLSRAARSDDPVRQAASRPESEVEPAPAAPVRDLDDYRELVRRYIAPVLSGEARPKARIATPYGPIIVELIAEEAPLTVHNFVTLAERGYFDDGVWHRVVPNFVLQDGAPGGYPSGGPGWSIRDEINRVRYARGTVGMALSGPDTGGSQWFITHSPQPHLDGGYTVFGRVLEGMDAADAVVQGDPIPTIRIER